MRDDMTDSPIADFPSEPLENPATLRVQAPSVQAPSVQAPPAEDQTPRTVAITGASGLIGGALAQSLRADGVRVIALVRRAARGADEIEWHPGQAPLDSAVLRGIGSVVHLAGAGIGDHRWSAEYKKVVLDSRVIPTATLSEAIAAAGPDGPSTLISGSAVGFYGDTGSAIVDESAPSGDGYLAEICRQWEGATAPALAAGARVAYLRTGLVLAPKGGLLDRLRPLFRFGLGGRLGSGRQYQPWISLRDEIAAIRMVLDATDISGPVNLTGPDPVTNRALTAAMGRVMHRPTLAAVPAPALRIVLGEFADEGVLIGQRAVPGVLTRHNFTFQDPTIDSALRWALA
jgi:uncharacterized protein (TIGR01777 family)